MRMTAAEFKASQECRSEAAVRKEITEMAEERGHMVWSTSDKRKSRNTKGTPDLLISIGTQRGLCLGIEVKSQKGKPTKEQAVLKLRGYVIVVRSKEEAMQAIKEAEKCLRNVPYGV